MDEFRKRYYPPDKQQQALQSKVDLSYVEELRQ